MVIFLKKVINITEVCQFKITTFYSEDVLRLHNSGSINTTNVQDKKKKK